MHSADEISRSDSNSLFRQMVSLLFSVARGVVQTEAILPSTDRKISCPTAQLAGRYTWLKSKEQSQIADPEPEADMRRGDRALKP